MIDPNAGTTLIHRKKNREPKEGVFFAGLRIFGEVLKWGGILTIVGSILISCAYSIYAFHSYLPYSEQKMAGLVTIIVLSAILTFLICLLFLGGMMVVAGFLLRFAGTRKVKEVPDPGAAGREVLPIMESQSGPAAATGDSGLPPARF